ncbi:hypothetical protein TRIUR3_35396 [Triticum urartu]|uniref:Uncharacterized protein n=1 Tax=Triticum urartu TaxID=4572 RepID=M7Y5R9_TRIUA|nr:hypothetical protein TRIUR3_35396 [Triticum urartu]
MRRAATGQSAPGGWRCHGPRAHGEEEQGKGRSPDAHGEEREKEVGRATCMCNNSYGRGWPRRVVGGGRPWQRRGCVEQAQSGTETGGSRRRSPDLTRNLAGAAALLWSGTAWLADDEEEAGRRTAAGAARGWELGGGGHGGLGTGKRE